MSELIDGIGLLIERGFATPSNSSPTDALIVSAISSSQVFGASIFSAGEPINVQLAPILTTFSATLAKPRLGARAARATDSCPKVENVVRPPKKPVAKKPDKPMDSIARLDAMLSGLNRLPSKSKPKPKG